MMLPRLLAAVSPCLLVAPAPAQTRPAAAPNYALYDSFPTQSANRIKRATLIPHWLSSGQSFWYRNDTDATHHTYVLVRSNPPAQSPAFDHARLAAAISEALHEPVTADNLPIDDLAFAESDPGHLHLQSADRAFTLDLATYALTADAGLLHTAPAYPPTVPNARSRRAREQTPTRLTLLNRLTYSVDYTWIDTNGAPTPYGTLAPGQSRTVSTFAGHAWLITAHPTTAPATARSTASALALFFAEEVPATAIIGFPLPTTSPTRASGRRGPATTRNASPFAPFIREYNIFLRTRDNNDVMQLTTDGHEGDAYAPRFFPAPDGAHLAALRVIPAQEHTVYEVESSPRDQQQPRLHSFQYLKPGDRVELDRPHLFTLATHAETAIPTDLFPTPYDTSDPRWAPDGKSFTFIYNARGHQALRLLSVDAATGHVRTVIDEASKTFIDYSGKQFIDYDDPAHQIIWMSERDGWNHLYLYDEPTGTVVNQITRGPWVVRGVDLVDHARRQIYFHASGIFPAQDPYYIHFARINYDGSGLTWLTQADGTHKVSFPKADFTAPYYIDSYSRVDLPPISELHRSSDGAKLLTLQSADAAPLLATGWRCPERFTAKGRDGATDICGVIYRPNDFDPARKYPVIEEIYAGPQDSYVPKAFGANFAPHRLAQLGFITVQIDGMGTSNRSKAFHDVCWKNLADAGFPDRIAWLRAAAAQHPEMDLSRVGIYGGSAGGQNAARAVMDHGDFYGAAVADCGCHDNAMDKIWWNEQWMGYPVDDSYRRSSNVEAAKHLTGKLFLTVGELDTNVDPASTMQVVNALINAGKDFEFLIYPSQNHGQGAATPYGQHRRNEFFVRTLMAAPAP